MQFTDDLKPGRPSAIALDPEFASAYGRAGPGETSREWLASRLTFLALSRLPSV
jgi:hypothetical protein